MKEKIELELDNLLMSLDKIEIISNITTLKEELLNDNDLIEKIEKLSNMDKYDSNYINLKKELFENSKFVKYKELENEINYLILEINKKLNSLTDKKGC